MSDSESSFQFRNLAAVVLLLLGIAVICVTVALLLNAELNQQINLQILLLGGAGLLLTVVAALMSWRKARRLIRPISELIEGAERIGNGNYTHPLEVTGRHELAPLEEALEQMRQKLRQTTINTNYLSTVLNSMNDTVLVTSHDGEIRKINAAAERLLGYKESELRGTLLSDLIVPGSTVEPAHDSMPRTMDLQETVIRTASGQTIPVSISSSQIAAADAAFQGTIYVLRDITERKRAERRIRYLARFDSLTKLPNRMQFQHLLQQAIARARRADRGVALLYLDLDRYKEINDTFGHEAVIAHWKSSVNG